MSGTDAVLAAFSVQSLVVVRRNVERNGSASATRSFPRPLHSESSLGQLSRQRARVLNSFPARPAQPAFTCFALLPSSLLLRQAGLLPYILPDGVLSLVNDDYDVPRAALHSILFFPPCCPAPTPRCDGISSRRNLLYSRQSENACSSRSPLCSKCDSD